MTYHEIRGVRYDWFKSYLVKRLQQTNVEEITFPQLETAHGVPPGSVLGPLLFLICIIDLNEIMEHSTIRHFTDNRNTHYSNKPLKKIN